jgi:LuxR family maltose regulon positive regulatory protein
MDLEAGEAVEVGRSHIIKRPRLTRLLDETKARIILLVAPAGYGKTTLAREWLEGKPHAWYRGSTASADVAALALGLARAASNILPKAGERVEARLRVSKAPSDEADGLAELLAEDLAGWPVEAILAVDDYQYLCDSDGAERFFETLVSWSGIRLLVVTRTRPRWATARRSLYGEMVEIGRNPLAMNTEEAQAALFRRPESETSALLALADGWPALIGMACLASQTQLPRHSVPEEVYDFFAEELYRAADPGIRSALRLLALAPHVTPDIAEAMFGNAADSVLTQASELGFLTSRPGRFELHPLLRSFLASKFRMDVDDPSGITLARLMRVLLDRKEWDAAFDLASLRNNDTWLIELLRESHSELLEQGRLPTLSQWAMVAKDRGCDSPVIEFVDAELAFRGGRFGRAEALARQAAGCFPARHPLTSEAFWIAGTCAHLANRDHDALTYFSLGQETAVSDDVAKKALWGQFLSHDALEQDDEADLFLTRFIAQSGTTVDDRLRAATGLLRMATLRGGINGALADHGALIHLVDRARDPLIRSSFLIAYSWLLVLAGRYEEALATLQIVREFIRESFLDFVDAWVLQLSSTALLGLRRFRSSRAEIGRCAQTGAEIPLTTCSASWLPARLHLAMNRPQAAADTLDHAFPIARECRPAYAEHLAWRSLVHALLGEKRDGLELADQANSLSKRVEIKALVPWTRAILASNETATRDLAAFALQATVATGNVDSFVTVYRSCPRVLRVLVNDEQQRGVVQTVLERARDSTLAAESGLRIRPSAFASDSGGLTTREREVLGLVSQGLTNRQIGNALFIEEGTVKAHMRHLCKKLGVRTRTEAAMRATEFGL